MEQSGYEPAYPYVDIDGMQIVAKTGADDDLDDLCLLIGKRRKYSVRTLGNLISIVETR